MTNKKSTHGGHRSGAGRPKKPGKKITYATKLRPDHVYWLREQNNAARVLEILIDLAMGRKMEEN